MKYPVGVQYRNNMDNYENGGEGKQYTGQPLPVGPITHKTSLGQGLGGGLKQLLVQKSSTR